MTPQQLTHLTAIALQIERRRVEQLSRPASPNFTTGDGASCGIGDVVFLAFGGIDTRTDRHRIAEGIVCSVRSGYVKGGRRAVKVEVIRPPSGRYSEREASQLYAERSNLEYMLEAEEARP